MCSSKCENCTCKPTELTVKELLLDIHSILYDMIHEHDYSERLGLNVEIKRKLNSLVNKLNIDLSVEE